MRIPPPVSLALVFVSVLPAKGADAAPLPIRVAGQRNPLPVFSRGQAVTVTAGKWRVLDAGGRVVARVSRGGRLPTGRYGAFRLVADGKSAVSYAVIPDVDVHLTDRSSPFAMGAYFSMRYSKEDLPRAAKMFRRMGATASRDELRWDLVEPEPGRWTWDAFDRGMVAQHDARIEPLGLLDYWGAYVKDRPEREAGIPAFSDEAVKAFASYCRAAVRRYKPGGTLAKRMGWTDGWGVRHWEVWNEPATFWSGTPEQFGTLHKAAHAAIRAEQPGAVVHFSNIGAEWDTRALHVAGLKSFEGLTPHYYSPPRSPDAAGMDRQMRDTVHWYRARALKGNVWVSEVGWDTTMQAGQEMRQANYLVRAYAMALDAGMNRVFWYNFRDDGPPGPNGLNPWYGVIRQDLSPKPSYAAYAAMVSRLSGKKPSGRANLGGASAILFSHPAGPTAVVWADGRHGSLAPIPGVQWRDLMGNPGKGKIPLTDSPAYVVAPGKSVAWLKKRLEAGEVAGIPPVELRMLQIVRSGQPYLRLRARNLTRRSLDGVVAWTGKGFGPSVSVALRTGETREMEIPVGSPFRRPGGQQYAGVRFRFLAPGSARVPHETLVTGLVPDPVIPHSVREAPTMEEFWATAPVYRLNTRRYVLGLVPWSEKDLSAEARFLYDETGLWMRVIVTDDIFHQPNTGPNIWEADSVQVAISADGKTARHEFGYALTPEGPKAFRYGGDAGAGTLDARRAGTTLTYDIRIPWAEMSLLTGQAGEKFRMDFMINENDGHGRRGWLEFTPGIGTGNDPTRWVTWTLD